MSASELLGNLQHIGKYGGAGGIAARAASVEHLRPYLFAGDKDGIVCAIHFGQHGVARLQPRSYRDVETFRSALG